METFQTKISSQGQVSVPAEIRKRLGVEPGATLEWVVENDIVSVRRKGRYTWEHIQEMARPYRPAKPVTLEEMDEAIGLEAVERFERAVASDAEEQGVEKSKRVGARKHASR